MNTRGFTLLEVMVAVAILGLALTVILSAQAGLYAAGTHAANESIAIGMARCKMGEVEEELLRMGYPELDLAEEGPCCEEQTPQKMSCSWKVDRVELPQPPSFSEDNPAGDDATLDLAGGPTSSLPNGAGPFGALLNAGKDDAAALKGVDGAPGGLSALSSMLGESTGDVAGLAPLVMSMVYPSFKPMLEASIRKITVTVQWKEGSTSRDLVVQQYVTNPMRGGFGMSLDGMDPSDPTGLGAFTPGGPTDSTSPITPVPKTTITPGGPR